MSLLFHGSDNEDLISLVDSLLNGYGLFKELWQEPENNKICNDAKPASNLILKNIISRNFSSNYVSRKAITSALLKQKSTNSMILIIGRTILDTAKDSWRQLKKAYVFAQEFLQNGNIPSGKTIEDMFEYVLTQMWQTYYARSEKQLEDDNFNATNNKTPLLPSATWTYPGWACFVCFNPLNSNHNKLSIMTLADFNHANSEEKEMAGRNSLRAKRNISSMADCSSHIGKSAHSSSLSTNNDNLKSVFMELSAKQMHLESTIMAVSQIIKSKKECASRLYRCYASAKKGTMKDEFLLDCRKI